MQVELNSPYFEGEDRGGLQPPLVEKQKNDDKKTENQMGARGGGGRRRARLANSVTILEICNMICEENGNAAVQHNVRSVSARRDMRSSAHMIPAELPLSKHT